jgi:hypothetical protein
MLSKWQLYLMSLTRAGVESTTTTTMMCGWSLGGDIHNDYNGQREYGLGNFASTLFLQVVVVFGGSQEAVGTQDSQLIPMTNAKLFY